MKRNLEYLRRAILIAVTMLSTSSRGDCSSARTTFLPVADWDSRIVAAMASSKLDEAGRLLEKEASEKDLLTEINSTSPRRRADVIVHRFQELADRSPPIKAIWALKRAVAISRIANGQNSEVTASILRELASVLVSQKSYSEASKYLQESIKIGEHSGNARVQADGYSQLGMVAHDQNNKQKEAEYLKTATELYQRSSPGDHAYVGQQWNAQGSAELLSGNVDKAIESYSLALVSNAKQVASGGTTDDAIAWRMDSLVKRGDAYFIKGEFDKALADYEAVLRLEPKAPKRTFIAGIDDARWNAITILCDQDKPDQAERTNLTAPDRESRKFDYARLQARFLARQGKIAQAEAKLRSAMSDRSKNSPQYALCARQLIRLMVQQGKTADASRMIKDLIWQDGAAQKPFLPPPQRDNWGEDDLTLMVYIATYGDVLEKEKNLAGKQKMDQWFKQIAARVFSKRQSARDLPDVAETFMEDGYFKEAEDALKMTIALCSEKSTYSVRRELLLTARVYHRLLAKTNRKSDTASVVKAICQAEASHQQQ